MNNEQNFTINEETQKRLSPFRVIVAIFLFAGFVYGSYYAFQQWLQTRVYALYKPWFASYVDVTATPAYAFEQLGATKTHNVILSFIVASSTNPCTPSWGNTYTLNEAKGGIDLDRRIARLQEQRGSVAISFGGLLNNELATVCKDPKKLLNAYQSVVDRYKIDTVDLDLENNGLTDSDAMKRRAIAIATLQKNRLTQKKNLAIWLTLPVAPQGLTEEGTNAVSQMLASGVDLAGINVMTMDYGQSRNLHNTMEQASEQALNETHRQLGIIYKKAGINLNSATLWTKIGATPMIGQNDIVADVFTTQDANAFNKFAISQGLGRMSLWSANRDVQCGDNYINTKIVSDACSGIKQDKLQFATTLGNGFTGSLPENSMLATVPDIGTNIQQSDDPAKSPYQIWQPEGAYLGGTKVVWHRNVYQAKWWTQGNVPDDPVLQSWQTPWQLIGPVLPGEKPIPQPTLPPGTYPDWSGTAQYDGGQRVLFHGIPYQAKWWTQGDSPEIAAFKPDSSPWVPLTQKQVDEINAHLSPANP